MKVLALLIFISSFFAVTAFACDCVEVECNPCQNLTLVGSEKKSCGISGQRVCNKYICENKPDYFQCLSGASSYQDGYNQLPRPQQPYAHPQHPTYDSVPVHSQATVPTVPNYERMEQTQPTIQAAPAAQPMRAPAQVAPPQFSPKSEFKPQALAPKHSDSAAASDGSIHFSTIFGKNKKPGGKKKP